MVPGLSRPCRHQEADRDEADLEPSHEDVKSESSESGRLGFWRIIFGGNSEALIDVELSQKKLLSLSWYCEKSHFNKKSALYDVEGDA